MHRPIALGTKDTYRLHHLRSEPVESLFAVCPRFSRTTAKPRPSIPRGIQIYRHLFTEKMNLKIENYYY